MRCPIILLLTLISVEVSAQETLRWYPSKTRFPEGDCVRVHTPSQGEAYVEKVKPDVCRPEKTSFLWVNSNCYEVDADTQGQGFAIKTFDVTRCAPEGALYAFDPKKRECWVTDPSGGSKFRAKLDIKNCRPPEEEIVKKFIAIDEAPTGGECVEIHKTEDSVRWEKKVPTPECRPKETQFVWRKTAEFKGDCWEIANAGQQVYRDRVINAKCRPSRIDYRFDRTEEKKGDCYEVDYETKGEYWTLKVKPELCRIPSH